MRIHRRSTWHHRAGYAVVLPLLLASWIPTGALAQIPTRVDSLSTTVAARPDCYSPDLSKRREIALWGVGAGFLVTGLLLPDSDREVPAQGLDPASISWSMDRDIVGNSSLSANTASHWTLNAVRVFPFVLALATGNEDDRWNEFGRSSLVYAEAFLMTQGVTHFAKVALERARPYAYMPEQERPDHTSYDASDKRTFYSMPSGHSAAAWTGAALGMTDHLLRRPTASWVERAGIGFLGGALAGATSALRPEAGQHFPTDVLAGAGVGIAGGVAVSLLHRGEHPLPSSQAVLQMIGGTVAGTVMGVLLARAY